MPLYYRLRALLGFECKHEIELQNIQWHRIANEQHEAGVIGLNHPASHECEWCGKRGSIYQGRFIPSI